MDKSKADVYLLTMAKYFPADKMPYISERLAGIDDDRFLVASTLDLKDPVTMLLISIFVGTFGVDRFLIGDTGMGILKLLTGGLCGILTVIDWFMIMDKTKQKNFEKFMTRV